MEKTVKKTSVVQVLATASGGVITHVDQVLTVLEGAGYRVRTIHPPSVSLPHWQGPTRLVYFTSHPSLKQWRARKALARAMGGNQVVHAHGLRAGAMCALALSKNNKTPLVVTLHNLPVGGISKRMFSRVLLRVIARRAAVVLAVSPDLVAWACRLGAKNVELAKIPHNLEMPYKAHERSYPQRFSPERPLRLLTVARADRQKGLDMLLNVARWLHKQYPDCVHWQVVGDGPLLARLRRESQDISQVVEFCGWRSDVSQLMNAADVFVSTSLWEGQPVAIQEALAHSLPVIATDVGGTSTVLAGSGILVPRADVHLSDAVSKIFQNPQQLQELSAKAYKRAKKLPTTAQLLAQLAMIYSTLRPGK